MSQKDWKCARYVKLEGRVQRSMQCALVVYCAYGWMVSHRSFEYFMHTGNLILCTAYLLYTAEILVRIVSTAWESLSVCSLWRLWTHYPHCRFTHTRAKLRRAHLHAASDKTHIWNHNTEAPVAYYGSYLPFFSSSSPLSRSLWCIWIGNWRQALFQTQSLD